MAQQQQQQPAPQAQQKPVPPDVYTLASTNQLGTLQAQYRAKLAFLSGRALAILTGIATLGGAILIAYTLLSRGIDFNGIVNTTNALGLVLIGAGIWLGVNAVRYFGLRVYVFTEGLVQVKRNKTVVIRWDQIKTIWQNAHKRFISSFYLGTVHNYTVQRDDGKKFTYDDGLRNAEALGNTMIREVTNRLLPDLITTYDAGDPVTFGKTLRVSIHGISIGDEILLWNQVQAVQVVKGALSITKDGQPLNFPAIKAAKTPNFPLFLALVDYVMKRR